MKTIVSYKYFKHISASCSRTGCIINPKNKQYAVTRRTKNNYKVTLQWRHNGRDNVSNHQPRDCLLQPVSLNPNHRYPYHRSIQLISFKTVFCQITPWYKSTYAHRHAHTYMYTHKHTHNNKHTYVQESDFFQVVVNGYESVGIAVSHSFKILEVTIYTSL